MRGWLPQIFLVLLLSLVMAPVASAGTATSTYCFGGETVQATSITPPAGPVVHVAHEDQATFTEDNDRVGLQRTARQCITNVYDEETNRLISQTRTTVYPPDAPVGGGVGGGCAPPPATVCPT